MTAVAGHFPNLPETPKPLGFEIRYREASGLPNDVAPRFSYDILGGAKAKTRRGAKRRFAPMAIGDVIGTWTVTHLLPPRGSNERVVVRCECGIVRYVLVFNLRRQAHAPCGHPKRLRQNPEAEKVRDRLRAKVVTASRISLDSRAVGPTHVGDRSGIADEPLVVVKARNEVEGGEDASA